MKLPRISVSAIMTGVVIIAVDCMIVRSINSRNSYLTSEWRVFSLIGLPMANILVALLALMIRSGRGLDPFRLGFQVAGWAALVASVWWVNSVLRALEWAIVTTGLAAFLASMPTFLQIGFLPISFLVPQVSIALAGGYLIRLLRGRVEAPADRPVGRPRLAAMAGFLVLLVSSGIGIEWMLWRQFDQRFTRLATGSGAIVRVEPLPQVGVTLLDGTTGKLPDLARVRVDLDDRQDVLGMVQVASTPSSSGPQPIYMGGDLRMVRVTLLEGERAGQSATIPRLYLSPR